MVVVEEEIEVGRGSGVEENEGEEEWTTPRRREEDVAFRNTAHNTVTAPLYCTVPYCTERTFLSLLPLLSFLNN